MKSKNGFVQDPSGLNHFQWRVGGDNGHGCSHRSGNGSSRRAGMVLVQRIPRAYLS